ncbi:Zn(2)-C6 fungal-type DNA-binding domain protein [Cordyceps fumosorosea ARSEF 2679]|uniref:Zn(2)-C6 fungal-type DNA-binding domain protein n=1 Tax=Cordyceps fumosorosea (strain ARSEF 2679) TaxID=1081104 RepID=A0A162IGD6_CORFA|nr:Zn(2)-C6 fungal-type DNA-binding domain protein [Cordyceps fumosorosea ARSEF 2679]OAA56785.1 Zn(2)-C6 fungal-type DNA-binding domain protein [Cordyceps fumosorosea ARSEF 2679]
MVGVPGRSKGCRTCRRRKKGCDKVEPACSQCRAAGLPCEGYGRDLVWVNSTTSAAPPTGRPPPAAAQPAPWHVRHAGTGTGTPVVLRDSLARTAREQKYLGLFCASVVGHQHGDGQLVVTGLRTYSAALAEMAAATANEERRLGDGLLAASRLMEFYEILFGNDSGAYPDATMHVDGWRGHNNGQMALVLARGPSKLQSGTGHQLFADGRLNMVVGDIARRRRSELATPQWKQEPWKTQSKSIKDKLIDILVDVPGLLEDLDKVKATDDPDAKERARLRALVACKACHHQLTLWEGEVGDDLFVYDYVVSGDPLPVPKTDVDTALLQMTSLYWVVCILLYSTIGLLMREARQPPATPQPRPGPPSYPSPPASVSPDKPSPASPSPTDDDRRNPRLCAHKIARSVHLFWEPAAGAFGNHVGLLPLGVAMRFLAGTEPRIEASDAYSRMRSLFRRPFLGSHVGTFLSNLQREAPSEELRGMGGDEGIQARAHAWWHRSGSSGS